jgi:hypothetical protein
VKYIASLLLGLLVGILLFAVLLFVNPFTSRSTLSPIAVGSGDIVNLSYSTAIDDSIVFTNNGETRLRPHPAKVLQLWEGPVRNTRASATVLRDSRGEVAGIGVKFSSHSEETHLLNGQALVDSAWHIYLPGRGTLFIEQSENYWSYLREIVLPAYWSSADNWKGNWHGTLTSGPGALGTARVTGGSGEFDGIVTDGIETVSAKAYSLDKGPVAVEAQLTIELPSAPEAASAEVQD